MSIRLRLTLWYTTILATTIVVFGAALYYLLTFTLLSSIDRQLEATASEIAGAARVTLSPFLLEHVIEMPDLDRLARPGVQIQVVSLTTREIIAQTNTLAGVTLPLNEGTVVQARAGQTVVRTVSVRDQRWRVYTVPLAADGWIAGVVQAGTPLAQIDETQRELLGIEIAGGVLATVLSAVLGAFLARAALRPIDQITQTALTISRAEDLSRRLAVDTPQDEVGRLAGTFNEMLTRLEGLFRTQQRLIADVSHELRTPLTTIQGNVDLLQRGAAEDPDARQEVLADIEAEVSRMSRLVADLLLLARVDAGEALQKAPVEMDTLLLEAYRHAQMVGNRVDVRLGHEDQAVVLGDADRLRQLLLNLVDNAIKYTPAGGRVTLSLHHEADVVRVVVSDTGIGIPAQDLELGPHGVPRIFERFYRADRARSSVHGGAGLGLSIAHWIVRMHGGEIVVESEVGQGSTFTVRLPAIPSARLDLDGA